MKYLPEDGWEPNGMAAFGALPHWKRTPEAWLAHRMVKGFTLTETCLYSEAKFLAPPPPRPPKKKKKRRKWSYILSADY